MDHNQRKIQASVTKLQHKDKYLLRLLFYKEHSKIELLNS
jgi:hypothetical protein